MNKKNDGLILRVIAVCLFLILIVGLFWMWKAVTASVSGEIDCSSNYIEYVTYDKSVYQNAPDCIRVVDGVGYTVCALPKDLHCKVTLQNFPILRGFMEAMR